MTGLPCDTHQLDAMKLAPETREMACGIIARLRAFVRRWQDSRDAHGSPARALSRTKWMLDAIGARIHVIPGLNMGSTQERQPRYLISFVSPLGWQSFNIMETNEALYAKLFRRLDMMERQVRVHPATADMEDHQHFIDVSQVRDQTEGLLEHATNMRLALRSESIEDCRIPLGFTPVAARALAAVMKHRTLEDWRTSDRREEFWRCSGEEYSATGAHDIHDILPSWTDRTQIEILAEILDWRPSVKVTTGKNQITVHITSIGHRVRASAPSIAEDDAAGKIQYDDHWITLTGHALPESAIMSMTGKRLDDIIDHWLTRGSGALIGDLLDQDRNIPSGTRQDALVLVPGPGPVLHLPLQGSEGTSLPRLRHPGRLRLLQ